MTSTFDTIASAKSFAADRRAEGRTCRILKSQRTIVGSGRRPTVTTVTKFVVEVA